MLLGYCEKQKKTTTRFNVDNTLVFCLKWNYMRENQPRLTLAAAYIRHKMNRLNVYGSHKMQIACMIQGLVFNQAGPMMT